MQIEGSMKNTVTKSSYYFFSSEKAAKKVKFLFCEKKIQTMEKKIKTIIYSFRKTN